MEDGQIASASILSPINNRTLSPQKYDFPFEFPSNKTLSRPKNQNSSFISISKERSQKVSAERFYRYEMRKLISYSNMLSNQINYLKPKKKLNRQLMEIRLRQYDESIQTILQESLSKPVIPKQKKRLSVLPLKQPINEEQTRCLKAECVKSNATKEPYSTKMPPLMPHKVKDKIRSISAIKSHFKRNSVLLKKDSILYKKVKFSGFDHNQSYDQQQYNKPTEISAIIKDRMKDAHLVLYLVGS
jgi:hypothetical protein